MISRRTAMAMVVCGSMGSVSCSAVGLGDSDTSASSGARVTAEVARRTMPELSADLMATIGPSPTARITIARPEVYGGMFGWTAEGVVRYRSTGETRAAQLTVILDSRKAVKVLIVGRRLYADVNVDGRWKRIRLPAEPKAPVRPDAGDELVSSTQLLGQAALVSGAVFTRSDNSTSATIPWSTDIPAAAWLEAGGRDRRREYEYLDQLVSMGVMLYVDDSGRPARRIDAARSLQITTEVTWADWGVSWSVPGDLPPA